AGRLLEDGDELAPDDFAFLLGIEDALELRNKAGPGVHRLERNVEAVPEKLFHLLSLAGAEQPVVHEDALESITDRAVHQDRRHRAVDSSGERADHPAVFDLTADGLLCLSSEALHRPATAQLALAEEKRAEHLFALRRMDHFWVKLDAVDRPRIVCSCGIRGVGAARDGFKMGRGLLHPISVVHPT